jgi:hypothetical protein
MVIIRLKSYIFSRALGGAFSSGGDDLVQIIISLWGK